MTHNNDLEQRLKTVEDKLRSLEGSILIELKQFTEFHNHTFGGKVVWEFPPELNKKILAAYKAVIDQRKADKVVKGAKEHLNMTDELEIFITPGASKVNE